MEKTSLSNIANIYTPEYFGGERNLSIERIKDTVHLLGDVKGKSILDLGCGTGEGSIFLKNLGADVTCVDISKYAAMTCKDSNLSSIQSATNFLPFAAKSFDGVLFMDVIEHIPRHLVTQTLLDIKRVTKPEGKIAIHTMPTLFLEKLSEFYGLINKRHWRRWGTQGGHINTYTAWRLKKDLMSAGLGIVKFEIGKYPANGPFSKIITPCSGRLRVILGNDLWACCSPKTSVNMLNHR